MGATTSPEMNDALVKLTLDHIMITKRTGSVTCRSPYGHLLTSRRGRTTAW